MDSDRFDDLTRSFSSGASRRRLLSRLGSGLVAVLVTGRFASDEARATKPVRAERCLAVGEKCPKTIKHGRKQVKHSCARRCCTRYSVVSADGKRRCACREAGTACTAATARQCCSGVCDGTVCAGTAGLLGPTGPPGPPGPPPVCPAICPPCQVCNSATGQCEVCPAACIRCFTLTDRSTVCGTGVSLHCDPCTTAADCPIAGSHCIAAITDLRNNQVDALCAPGGGCSHTGCTVGACGVVQPCP